MVKHCTLNNKQNEKNKLKLQYHAIRHNSKTQNVPVG